MRYVIFLLLILTADFAAAFSYATGECTNGCASGEAWLHSNANEIDTALDALETTTASHTSTLSGLATTYLALAGGTVTGGIVLNSGASIELNSGVSIVANSGALIEPAVGGSILATAMSATGQIDDNDLAAGAVDGGTGGEIADGSITSADIADGTVTGTDILNDTVVLTTDTSGDYVATVTGDTEITVSGAGTEGRAVTLAIASAMTRDTELAAVSTGSSTDNAIVRFDGTTGDVQDSLATVADTTGTITTPGALSVGGSTGASTFTLRNTVDSGWVECGVVGTTMTCAVDADGTPDGTL